MTDESRFRNDKPRSFDFNNMRDVEEILVSGSDADLERLRLHAEAATGKAFAPETMLLYREFARQRDRHIKESDAEAKEREAQSPKATVLECRVGTYKERLEKPVREAVFQLREKGYSSFESGWGGSDRQHIGFNPPIPELANHLFSEQTQTEAVRLGTELIVRADRVGFKMTHPLPDEDMINLWNLIATELPPLDPPQPDTLVSTAQHFREKQTQL